jgi:hypothetical protein
MMPLAAWVEWVEAEWETGLASLEVLSKLAAIQSCPLARPKQSQGSGLALSMNEGHFLHMVQWSSHRAGQYTIASSQFSIDIIKYQQVIFAFSCAF